MGCKTLTQSVSIDPTRLTAFFQDKLGKPVQKDKPFRISDIKRWSARTCAYYWTWLHTDNHVNNSVKSLQVYVKNGFWNTVVVIVTHAGVGRVFSRICPYCLRVNRKTAWAINTKLGTHILYSSRSAYIDPESKGQGHTVTKTITVAQLLVTRAATAYAGEGTHVDSTAYVF